MHKLGLVLILVIPAFAAPSAIDEAFTRMYNFDFHGAHLILDRQVAAHPDDPLPYAVRSSAFLFSELDRLGILEGQFLTDDKRIGDKRQVKADPNIRALLFQAVENAQSRALAILGRQSEDRRALLSMSITQGVVMDYTALVEKRQFRSLSSAKESNRYAQQLLKVDPNYFDAYLSTGLTEYMVGSLPFFVRWFVRFDQVDGSKEQGFKNLHLVAEKGRYFGPFARILLALMYLREKQPQRTKELLQGLARDFPSNPLFQKELARLSVRLEGGR